MECERLGVVVVGLQQSGSRSIYVGKKCFRYNIPRILIRRIGRHSIYTSPYCDNFCHDLKEDLMGTKFLLYLLNMLSMIGGKELRFYT